MERVSNDLTPNVNFIHANICECCGKRSYSTSKFRLEMNSGSKYDEGDITLSVCGECADRIWHFVLEQSSKQTSKNLFQ